ncbi:MAG: glycosyltransferase family 4 protein, partial [Gammaproteobacteria bacterium]
MTNSRPQGADKARVLVLLSQVYADGGIQRFNRTFLSACARVDVACDVLSLGDSEESRTRWTAPAGANIRVFGYDKARFALTATAALVRGGYDLVIIGHVNLLTLVAAASRLNRNRHCRLVLVAHGIEVWSGLAARQRRAMRVLDLFLCVSHYTRQMILDQVPALNESRLQVFPNALSESWTARFDAESAESGRLADLPPRYLLSVTRLDRGDRYKGIVTVLETLVMLADSSIHYVIAGEGNDRPFLEGVAQRLGVRERVHFTGTVSDLELVRLYRDCAAFVLPSGKEGFGIVFLEAMFFGAVVVAASEKGAVDVVRHEETGLLVPYGDTVALKRSIDRLLSDGTLRARLRAAGRASVVDGGPFTFAAYVARLAPVLGVPAPAIPG